jgi:hypothetical protein
MVMARRGAVALHSSALKLDLRRIGYKAREMPTPLAEFPLQGSRVLEDAIDVGEAKLLAVGDCQGERAVVEVVGRGVFWGRLLENLFVLAEERGKAGRLFPCRGKFLFAPTGCTRLRAMKAMREIDCYEEQFG